LIWSSAISLLLVPFGDGITLTPLILLLGLFLYPDQPIVTAAALEIGGRNMATTALGVAAFGGFMMGAASPIIVGVLYETWGIPATLYYVAGLFASAAVIFFVLPLRASPD
jgi:sugar phosphate permease